MNAQLTLDQAWPADLQTCPTHGEYCPEAYYETVAQWLEDGCPLCMFDVVGYEL